jgi:4-oxalocrotonate tautomerase
MTCDKWRMFGPDLLYLTGRPKPAPDRGFMPHVIVKLYAGRSEELKGRLAEEIEQTVRSVLTCPEGTVSVSIEDVAPTDWAEGVYRAEILDKPETLYVKPGYNPFK